MYTARDNGGYAIGLKKSHIERQVRMMNETNPCIEAYLLPCLYTDTDTNDIDGILEYIVDLGKRSSAMTRGRYLKKTDGLV